MVSKKQILILAGACTILCAGILYFNKDKFGEHLYKGCHWINIHRTIVIQEKPYRLRFRAQKCTDPYLKMAYKIQGQNLVQYAVGHPDKAVAAHPNVIVYFWPYDPKTFKDKIAEVNFPTVNPDEAGQCAVVYHKETKSYSYEPKPAYMKRMLAKDEPFEACGTFGFNNDKTAFFRVIDKKVLAFFDIGQEAPLYVPQSFHLERR